MNLASVQMFRAVLVTNDDRISWHVRGGDVSNTENLGTRNLFCYFFSRSDHILTTQTTKNQNMAGTNLRTSKVWKCQIFLIWSDSAAKPTGLNVFAKNRRKWHSISSIQASKSQKRDFRHFSWGKSGLFKWKCQIREFHACGMERGEVLRRYCGWQKEAKLLKQKSKDRTFIHAASALQ